MTDIINTIVFPIVRRDHILNALKSLRLTTPPNYQTIVVDQTIPDAEFEEQLRGQCDVHIKMRKNMGFSQGTNIGWRFAIGTDTEYIADLRQHSDIWVRPGFELAPPTEFITTCNDDVVFVWNGWWAGIIESFRRYDTAVCVNPMSPKEPGWGYGEEGFRYHLTFEESIYPENILRLIHEKKGQMIDGLTCWCSIFKRELLLDKVGMFDERWSWGGGEDYDLMARIYAAGLRALATSLSWVWHWWGKSKDDPHGFDVALPHAREYWNKLGEVWYEGFDIWAKDPKTQKPLPRDPEVVVMPF